jgi:hypothetical protein
VLGVFSHFGNEQRGNFVKFRIRFRVRRLHQPQTICVAQYRKEKRGEHFFECLRSNIKHKHMGWPPYLWNIFVECFFSNGRSRPMVAQSFD